MAQHSAKQHKVLGEGLRRQLRAFAYELLLDEALPGRKYELREAVKSNERLQEVVTDLVNDMLIQGAWDMQDSMLDCIDEYREDVIDALEMGE